MGDLFGRSENELEESTVVENEKLLLREEELDIAKDKVQTGEVSLHKEVIEEHKAVDVPVMHEEVVIERRAIDAEPSAEAITSEAETIRIPVSEEQVEVGKHTIITGEVTAHKRAIEETEHIEETVMREEARIDSTGDANIVAEENLDQLQ